MPHFTLSYPEKSVDSEESLKKLYDWSCSLVDELKYVLSNLDEYNISNSYTSSITTQPSTDSST